tara:strand:+ start:111 stop:614 length:504 start_codon:yes stop_codon:yes gene_type:complete
MPERVTKEERMVSLVIEKAREAKEILYQSMQGNRLPERDDYETVKVKRPKAQKADKIKNQTRKEDGYGLAGEITEFKKAMDILKQILESDYEDNPVLNRERYEKAQEEIESATKELGMLLDKYKQDGDEKSFNESAQARIRELTRAMQTTEKKTPSVPLLPRTQQYR